MAGTILIIDDNEMNFSMAAELLERAGYTVIGAED
jgi:CheY-like chemotaxis protein